MHSGEAWAVSAALTLLAFLKKGSQHLWSCIAIILTFCWLNLFIDLCIDTKNIKSESPCWAVLDFWKINLEKSSLTNWIFSLFKTGFLLPVRPAKINLEIIFCRLKIQFVELDFSNLIFQNSSTDQQGECSRYVSNKYKDSFECSYRMALAPLWSLQTSLWSRHAYMVGAAMYGRH